MGGGLIPGTSGGPVQGLANLRLGVHETLSKGGGKGWNFKGC